MLRIAVCENMPADVKHIRRLLSDFQTTRQCLRLDVTHYENAKELLAGYSQEFDLCLLSVSTPKLDGIALARSLRRKGYKGLIIFLSPAKEFAFDAFSVKAANYLLKPVTAETLFPALDDAVSTLAGKLDTYAVVRTPDADIKVRLSDIVFIEVKGHVFTYHCANGKTLTSKVHRVSFEQSAADIIADNRFLRPHKSFLVNAAHVTGLSKNELLTAGGATVPVSRSRYAQIKAEYTRFLFCGACRDMLST